MQLYSYVKAIASLESNMRILTLESLLDIVTEIIHIKEQYDNSPYWLASVIPESLSRRVLETTWFVEFTRQFQSNYKDQVSKASANTHPSSGDTYRIQGLMFHSVPSGTLIQGSIEDKALATHLPHTVPIQGMFVSETEVPARLFSAFLQENPQWQRSDLEKLLSRGLVTESYLEGWTEEGFPEGTGDLPVTQVSWFAAEAFCRWFSSKLPSFLEGYEARLPTEAEWEWAARGGLVDAAYPSGAKPVTEVFFKPGISGPRPVGSSSPNGYGLRDTSGNVWEWCSDWHSPVAYLFSSWKPEKNKDDRSSEIPFGAEKAVRGGSWANEKELVKLYTRASQPPSWCTPYLGFRIVLARVRP